MNPRFWNSPTWVRDREIFGKFAGASSLRASQLRRNHSGVMKYISLPLEAVVDATREIAQRNLVVLGFSKCGNFLSTSRRQTMRWAGAVWGELTERCCSLVRGRSGQRSGRRYAVHAATLALLRVLEACDQGQ